MNSKLQQQVDLLEQLKADILEVVSALDEQDFSHSEGGKWSVGQILIHIVTSESLALQYMKKKSLGLENLENSGFIEPIKLTLLKISQRLPIKYKVPKGIHEKTPAVPSKEELLLAWEKVRFDLESFLESIEEKNINKKIFKHPIAGMFNAAQGVAFLREHLLHHKPQVTRLVSRFRSQVSG